MLYEWLLRDGRFRERRLDGVSDRERDSPAYRYRPPAIFASMYCRHLQLLQPWRRCVEVGDCRIGRSGSSNLPGKMSMEGQPIRRRGGLRIHSPPRNVASISNRKSKLFISSGCWFRLKDRRRQAVVKILSPSFFG